jgi:RNA polymerase sigma-70 factor (ECF subfamily)
MIERMKKIDFRTDILPLKNELYRLALRITLNPAEAEDVVQETMLKVWNRRESWDELESIEAFCLTICRNLALDKIRKMGRNAESIEDQTETHKGGLEIADARANPEEQAVQRDKVRLVRKLIDELPEKQRACMQLRDIEGKPYKEIAEVLGITEQQVKTNIFRARQTIKQKYIETEQYGL